MHNMADPGSSTRVTYRKNPNFIERIGNSLAGIVIGIGLISVSCYLIFWNEVKLNSKEVGLHRLILWYLVITLKHRMLLYI